jgi:hypothetical protein
MSLESEDILMQDYQKYRKFIRKPIPVLAYQTFDPLVIQTSQGILKANAGDWIVTSTITNEQSIMVHEQFMATYDRLEG